MNALLSRPPGFWRVVWLLLSTSRRRALGRLAQQRAMMRQRVGRPSMNWAGLGFFVTVIVMLGLNIAGSFLVLRAVSGGERIDAERNGRVVVDRWFLEWVNHAERQTLNAIDRDREIDRILAPKYRSEAHYRAKEHGGNEEAIAARLRQTVASHRTGDFIEEDKAAGGLKSLPGMHTLAALLGSIALAWWAVMLVFQGEGMELDTLRRRHPIWERLFSHPVSPGPIFLGDPCQVGVDDPHVQPDRTR